MMANQTNHLVTEYTYILGQDTSCFPAPGLRDVRILVIDNYDSFTYNLVQYLAEITATRIRVYRNDEITLDEIRAQEPTHIVLSPGPCTPDQAGISLDVVRTFGGQVPILGVCLGHQAIGQAYGGCVVRAKAPVHGKTSLVHHDRRGIFAGLPVPFVATRYHSLVLDRALPGCLEISAWTQDGVIMGIRHRELAVDGVQFHPESLLTAVGKDLLRNFLSHRGGLR